MDLADIVQKSLVRGESQIIAIEVDHHYGDAIGEPAINEPGIEPIAGPHAANGRGHAYAL